MKSWREQENAQVLQGQLPFSSLTHTTTQNKEENKHPKSQM
jgi:hypothetical protein